MRRGLKHPLLLVGNRPSLCCLEDFPDEKGIETLRARAVRLDLKLVWKTSPMRRGLKLNIRQGKPSLKLPSLEDFPDEKGIET